MQLKKWPMGRLGRPEDLVGLILFLISDKSLHITGQNILVDGGKTIVKNIYLFK